MNLFIFAMALGLSFLSPSLVISTFAHHTSPIIGLPQPGLPGGGYSSGNQGAASGMINIGAEGEVQYLVALSWNGINGGSVQGWGGDQYNRRYFWITAATAIGETRTDYALRIVPVVDIGQTSNGFQAISWLPTSFRRNISIGLEDSMTIEAIGYAVEKSAQILPSTEKLQAIWNVAVNAFGLRVMHFTNGTSFAGGQIGSVDLGVGLRYFLDQNALMTFRVGTRDSLALGSSISGALSYAAELALFARLETLLFKSWNIFAEGGVQGFSVYDQASAGFSVQHDGHDHGASTGMSPFYFTAGVQYFF